MVNEHGLYRLLQKLEKVGNSHFRWLHLKKTSEIVVGDYFLLTTIAYE